MGELLKFEPKKKETEIPDARKKAYEKLLELNIVVPEEILKGEKGENLFDDYIDIVKEREMLAREEKEGNISKRESYREDHSLWSKEHELISKMVMGCFTVQQYEKLKKAEKSLFDTMERIAKEKIERENGSSKGIGGRKGEVLEFKPKKIN